MVDQPGHPFNKAALTVSDGEPTFRSMMGVSSWCRSAWCRSGRSVLFLGLIGMGLCTVAEAATRATLARIVVKTLVVDGMGTRTVDTSTAHVPFGSTGLLIRKIPYGGRPLSYRLSIRPGTPRRDGMPLDISARVWSGGPEADPSGHEISHRAESTILADQTSYLLELFHENEGDLRPERRILLSIKASAASSRDVPHLLHATTPHPVRFLVEIIRRQGSETAPPDRQLLSGLVGESISYRWGSRSVDSDRSGTVEIHCSVTATPVALMGDLITVKIEFTGSESAGKESPRFQPIHKIASYTVRSGTPLEMVATLPAPEDSTPSVTYLLSITPLFD